MVLLRGEENCRINLNNTLLTVKEQEHFLLTGFSNSRGRIRRLEAGRYSAANMKMGLFVLLLCSFNLSVLCYKPVLESCKALSHLKAISHGQQCWWREWRGNTLTFLYQKLEQGRESPVRQGGIMDQECSCRSLSPRASLPHPLIVLCWYVSIWVFEHLLGSNPSWWGNHTLCNKEFAMGFCHPSHQEKVEVPHTALSLSAESHTRNQVRLQIQHSAVVKQSNDGVFFWPNHGSVLQPPVLMTNVLSPKPDVVLTERLKAFQFLNCFTLLCCFFYLRSVSRKERKEMQWTDVCVQMWGRKTGTIKRFAS